MHFLLTALLATAPIAAPLPPEMPWHGSSERLIAQPADPWITPAEQADFRLTPSYADTRRWIDRLVAASPLLRIVPFGRSAQGRELYAVYASKPLLADAPKKPVLLVQAGIHAGEIDGKDAGLMLLRDIALRGKDKLLDRADLLFVPIFNVDGHERVSPFNRPNQRGPENQGWRTTAQNLNLNRDYLKADAPEMRAMLALIQRYDPSLYLDIHVTDGVDHQYDITFEYNGWNGRDARSPAIARWLDHDFRPAEMTALATAGHVPGYYVDTVDGIAPDAGILALPHAPRFSEGYGDLRHIPTVLVETHSLKPYRRRVLGTYVLMETALETLGRHADADRAAIAQDRATRPSQLVLAWRKARAPIGYVPFKGIAHRTYASVAAGGPVVQWLGTPTAIKVPVYGEEASVTATLPVAYWVPATKPEVIARLKLQGVQLETLAAPRTIDVDMIRFAEPHLLAADEGHVPVSFGSMTQEGHRETYPAGSVRVPVDQPLGQLAAMMLEPASPDSLASWGLFPELLQRTEYIENYALAPMADRMLGADPALKAAFEAKLRADPAFAADEHARLAWFYARSPYYDERYLLYPVGRELARPAAQ